MRKQITNLSKHYLLIPIYTKAPTRCLSIFSISESESLKIFEFDIPYFDSTDQENYPFHYFAPLPISSYESLCLEGNFSERFFSAICLSDTIPLSCAPHPHIHFTADHGWINDPNGFFYQDGLYHLYFQHNPFDVVWGNMTWGHAVSRDLLHWTQKDNVLFPDETGTMFSGCAILNEKGLLQLPDNTPLFFYTCGAHTSDWSKDKEFVQNIAWSTDGGNTLIKRKTPVVEHITADNRDPKVYWHEASNAYIMSLYLENYDYAILRSEDLLHWSVTQTITLDKGWECPDLRPIPTENGSYAWVFWSADGYYWLGDFDGYTFTRKSERQSAYLNPIPYAAQTCFQTPERIIQIPWLRTNNEGALYTGAMGLPRELILAEKNGALILKQKLIRELSAIKEMISSSSNGILLHSLNRDNAYEIFIEKNEKEQMAYFSVQLGNLSISYQSETGYFQITGCLKHGNENVWRPGEEEIDENGVYGKQWMLSEPIDDISIILDHEILEITINDGLDVIILEIPYSSTETTTTLRIETAAFIKLYKL